VSDIIVIQPDENNVVVSEVTNSITTASDGPQGPAGPTGATGATGATGPAGSSGVVAVTAPITNSGTSSSANIGISAGSTSAAGALQLTDSVASTSTTTAATPNSVKTAYDLANQQPFAPKASKYFRTAGNGTTLVATDNRMYLQPITFGASVTITRIGIGNNSFTTTGNTRLGIYSCDTDGMPLTLVLDAGTVSTTATGWFYITISQTLTAGRYWIAVVKQSGTYNHFAITNGITLTDGFQYDLQTSLNNPAFPFVSSVTGALPSSITSYSQNAATPIPVVMLGTV
jgi:hypothetical protein